MSTLRVRSLAELRRPASAKPFKLRAPQRRDEQLIQETAVRRLDLYLPEQVVFCGSINGMKLEPKYLPRLKAMGVRKGFLDLQFICLLNGERLDIEVKTAMGEPTPEQAAILAALGDKAAICRSADEIISAVAAWMAPFGLRMLTDSEAVRRTLRRAA